MHGAAPALIEHPFAVAVDNRTRRVFVVGYGPYDPRKGYGLGRVGRIGAGGVSVLDAATGRVLRTIRTGTMNLSGAESVAMDEHTGRVFVLNNGNVSSGPPRLGAISRGTVSVLDAATGTLLRTVRVGSTPGVVVVDARAGRVFVFNQNHDINNYPASRGSVSVLDATTGRVLRTVPVGKDPVAAAVDEKSGRVFVANAYGGISVLGAATGRVLSTINLATACDTEADSTSGRVIVQASNSDYTSYIFVIDERRGTVVRRLLALGTCGLSIGHSTAMDQLTGHAFVFGTTPPGYSDATVTVLNVRSGRMVRSVGVINGEKSGLWALDPHRGRAFLAHDDDVSVFDTRSGRLLRTVAVAPAAVAPELADIAVATSTGRIFVVEPDGDVVKMLDERTLAVLPLGKPAP